MNKEIPIPDPDLTAEEKALVAKLSQKDLQAIDEALLSNARSSWRKVAMVVGITMLNLSNSIKGIPDVFYSQRIRNLVENGRLEAQGNLQFMRFSEVRIPSAKETHEA